MTKITLDRDTFKALASDTRLEILRVLDGKKLGLNDLMKSTSLNKATLHEHLSKLNEAGLVKRQERQGHKWVYYKLTWKGESLLHPENTRIVVLFTTTFIALWVGIIQLIQYAKGSFINIRYPVFNTGEMYHLSDDRFVTKDALVQPIFPEKFQKIIDFVKHGGPSPSRYQYPPDGLENGKALEATGDGTRFVLDTSEGVIQAVYQNPLFLYIAVSCFFIFTIVTCVALWRLWVNRTPKL